MTASGSLCGAKPAASTWRTLSWSLPQSGQGRDETVSLEPVKRLCAESREPAEMSKRYRPVTLADLPTGPDPVGAWSNLDLLTRRVVGRRLERGPTSETDEALDKLMILRAWTARRLVN
jgi:hypothetical protein